MQNGCLYFIYLHVDPYETRLEEFFYRVIREWIKKYEKIWNLMKMLLIVSHGQPSVERWFSVNRHLEMENLQGEINNCGEIN